MKEKHFSVKLFSFSVGQTFKQNGCVWRIMGIDTANGTRISVMPIIDACGDYIPANNDLIEVWHIKKSPTVLECVKFSDSSISRFQASIDKLEKSIDRDKLINSLR